MINKINKTKKLLTIPITCWLFAITCSAQTKTIDSIKTVLPKASNPKLKVELLNRLIYLEWANSAYDTALAYSEVSFKIIKEPSFMVTKKDADYAATTHYYTGLIKEYQGYNTAAINQYYLPAVKLFEEAGNKTKAAEVIDEIAVAYSYAKNDSQAIVYYKQALARYKENGYKDGVNQTYFNMALSYQTQANFQESIKLLMLAKQGYEEVKEQKKMATCLSLTSYMNMQLGNFPEALKLGFAELKISEDLKDKKGISNSYTDIGNAHYFAQNNEEALKYHQKAIEINMVLNDKAGIAACYLNLGNVARGDKKWSDAIDYYKKSMDLDSELKNYAGTGMCCNNMGAIYYLTNKYEKALEFHLISLKMRDLLNDKYGLAQSNTNVGATYIKLGKFKEAEEYLNKGLAAQKEIRDKKGLKYCYGYLAELDSARSNLSSSLANYKLYIIYKDSTLNEENTKKAMKMEMNYEFDKKELAAKDEFDKQQALSHAELEKRQILLERNKQDLHILEQENQLKALSITESKNKLRQRAIEAENDKKAIDLLHKDKDLQAAEAKRKSAELEKQKLIRNAFIGGFVLLGMLAFVIYRSLRQNKKKSKIILEQKQEVEKQKGLIEFQKAKVEEHQKEIVDSITYAKRLQQAILPPLNFVKKHLPETFILYKPKDIVAGDFYWMETVSLTERSDGGTLILIAAADCTGHGVPGAMVSVVCSNALNRTVNEFGITETGKILDKTRELVVETFARSESEVKDGMDISIASISINEEDITICWSGANNPLWYIQDGALSEITAHKQPIGATDAPKPFATHTFKLKKGGIFYLFTDGYPDQFGGIKGKKFKYKQLEEFLLQIHSMPMDTQHQLLDKAFEQWKGELEQVDDVTVIGIRV